MESDFTYWICTWSMACKVQVTGCLQDEECSEKLEVGQAPRAVTVAWGSICVWGLAQPHGEGWARHKAQLHVQLPQTSSFLNLELCFRAASPNGGKIICCGLCMFFYDTKKDFCHSVDCFCFSCCSGLLASLVCLLLNFFVCVYLSFSFRAF